MIMMNVMRDLFAAEKMTKELLREDIFGSMRRGVWEAYQSKAEPG